MRIGYFILGALFLFNPTVSSVDVLPDLFGYILILYSIGKLSDLDAHILTAKKKFRALVFVSSGELAVMLLSSIFDSTWRLIFAFAFSVLQMVYAVPAFISLFYGISYLEVRMTDHKAPTESDGTLRHGGVFDKTELSSGTAYFEVYEATGGGAELAEAVRFSDGIAEIGLASAGFSSRGKKKQTLYRSDEARVSCLLFVAIRAICACLPEFTTIFGTSGGYTAASEGEFSGLHTILCVILGMISLAFGILWLVRMVRYFNIFRRDTDFVSALENKYKTEIETDTVLLTKRSIARFGTLSVVALAMLTSFQLNGVEIAYQRFDSFFFMPEFIFGVLMLFAFALTKWNTAGRKRAIRLSAAYILPSAISYAALFLYALYCGGYAFPYQENGFLPIYLTYMGGFAVAMAFFILLIPEKKRVYFSMADTAATLFSAGLHEMAEHKRAESFAEMSKRIRRVMTAEYVYAALSILCMAVVPLGNEWTLFGQSFLIRAVFGILLMIGEARIVSQIQYELERVM